MSLEQEMKDLLAIARERGLTRAVEYLQPYANKPGGTPRTLWQVDHPYYCNESNYFKGDEVVSYHPNWDDFLKNQGDADEDLNLVFRWDWKAHEPGHGDQKELLSIYWVRQRKGYFAASHVDIEKKDEPSVRAWLQKRFEHLLTLWEPFVWLDDKLPEAADHRKYLETLETREGECVACSYEPVTVYPMEVEGRWRRFDPKNRTTEEGENGKYKVWICRACYETWASSAIMYPEQYYEASKTLFTMNNGINRILAKLAEWDEDES